jgi:hypothetical protein
MKRFFRFALSTLVLLVVALVSALTTMRFAIHGREVAVPNLAGKNPAEARRVTEEGGFELTVENRYYSSTVPAGKILSQAPAAESLVRRGWEIRVAQSLGPQRIQIPTVVGQSERAAEMNIERRGLEISAVAEMPWPADAAHPAASGQAASGQITNDEVLAHRATPGERDLACAGRRTSRRYGYCQSEYLGCTLHPNFSFPGEHNHFTESARRRESVGRRDRKLPSSSMTNN